MFYSFLTASLIFVSGMSASFFFSGTEIGYYRVSRAKLVLDSLLGCRRSKYLLWLTNHPMIFISTVLLGNNLANYFVSMGTVLLFQVFYPNSSAALFSTLIATPFVFIYGELLPKSIFLQAPTRLLRRCSPVYVILVPLFLPVSLIFGGLNHFLAWLVGEKSRHYALQMTDTELEILMDEGMNEGILEDSQQTVAEKLFRFKSVSLESLVLPVKRFLVLGETMPRDEKIRKARQAGVSWFLIQNGGESERTSSLTGFNYFSDLLLTSRETAVSVRKALEIPTTVSYPEAMGRMLTADVPFAVLVSTSGEPLGILKRDELLRR